MLANVSNGNANSIKGKIVDDTSIGDGKALAYDVTSDSIIYKAVASTVAGITGNFVGIGAGGALVDSGSKSSDFAAATHTHTLSEITDAGTAASHDANDFATTSALSTTNTNVATNTGNISSLSSSLSATNSNVVTNANNIASVSSSLSTHSAQTTAAHGGIVASTDSRLTNARTPTAHAATHISTGTDAIALAVGNGASGLLSGADKHYIDTVPNQLAAKLGRAGTIESLVATDVLVFDSGGNAADSGVSISDLATNDALDNKMDKLTTATDGNVVVFDATGNASDLGISVSSLAQLGTDVSFSNLTSTGNLVFSTVGENLTVSVDSASGDVSFNSSSPGTAKYLIDGPTSAPSFTGDGSALTNLAASAMPVGYANRLGHQSSRYYVADNWLGTVSNGTFTSQRLVLQPFNVKQTVTFTHIGCTIGTAGAGSKVVRMAVYNSASGVPTTVVTGSDSGAISTTTASDKEATISITLSPGDYFIAICSDDTTASLVKGSNSSADSRVMGFITSSGNSASYFFASSINPVNALPNNPSVSVAVGGNPFFVWLRK